MTNNQDRDWPDPSNLQEAIVMPPSCVKLESIAQACPGLLKELHAVHPIKAAATFGSLLTQKRLQPNCLRLETLVHLCLAASAGSHAPTSPLLVQGYTAVGRLCGHLEDPPEDLFVGNIYSKRGNYRVLEGIWESGTFYLQRFVNLVDTLPNTGGFLSIVNSIHALLKLSDKVCERAGLKRNEVGHTHGENYLPRKLADKSNKLRKLVQFGFDELREIGIDINDLQPFIFDLTNSSGLLSQSVSNSDLEACPLGIDGDQLYLLIPTAISAAIRRFFVLALGSEDNRETFLNQLGLEYSRLFEDTPSFGGHCGNVPFSHLPWGSVCCTSQRVDEGRYLNLIFFMDTLEDFHTDGFAGTYSGNDRFINEISRAASAMQNDVSKLPGFRDGILVVIGCGIGRGAAITFSLERRENWELEFLSAADYCTLSRVRSMEPLNLWRITQMRSSLAQMKVWLFNINGFLNLYAWADSLDGHLVPHSEVPENACVNSNFFLSITQNSLLKLRLEVARSVDQHVEQFVDGSWLLVSTEGASYFDEDNRQPLYGHLRYRDDGGPLGACITQYRCWWYEVVSPKDGPNTATYDRWKMLGTWLARAVRSLEDVFAARLGIGPIIWSCMFEQPQGASGLKAPGTANDAMDAIRTIVNIDQRSVQMCIGVGFDHAIYHHENIAENALVKAFVNGIAELVGDQETDLDRVIHTIVPNQQARHAHMFPARQFRDFIHSLLEQEPVTISSFDDAAIKLGLGWRARSPADGGRIEGKTNSLAFLNKSVELLEDELCEDLRAFNRLSVLSKLLLNHELASASRERWHKTAAAMLALRDDKKAALSAMQNHELKLNAAFQAGRNLMEMAVCESPVDGGKILGDLDLSRLLAKASQIYHIGGLSDLIRWDFLAPFLIIRPLGDIHAKLDFIDTVIDSFGSAASEYRYMNSAQGYANNFERPSQPPTSKKSMESMFLTAWQEDFGVEFESYLRFIEAVENMAIKRQEPVLQILRSELSELADSPEIGLKIIENLSLVERPYWRHLPDDYEDKDISFWRLRRRLSILRRPLLQPLNPNADPLILFAPGLLREGFAYTVARYHDASYPDRHLGPAMKRYSGYARNRDGLQFNKEVADKMKNLGWAVHLEITITKILNKSFDRNYGDVDVLAWDASSGRVLIMECKDLQFRKTYGEIAEQLSDFQGVVPSDGKRRDLLRKHLDRVEILREHISQVKKYLNLKGDCSIESHIVFRHPVPMQFSQGTIRQRANLHILADLDKFSLG